MRKIVIAIAVAAVLGLRPSPASGVLLSDLNFKPTSGLIHDSLLFFDFEIVISQSCNPCGFGASTVIVEGSTDAQGNPGLRFSSTSGPFFITDNGGDSQEYLWQMFYQVTVLDPAFLISDIHASLEGADPAMSARTSMRVFDLSGDLASTHASAASPDGFAELSRPVRTARMLGDFIMEIIRFPGTDTVIGTSGEIESFAHSYSLAPVPEPGTLLLIGLGIVGMGTMARKRSRRK